MSKSYGKDWNNYELSGNCIKFPTNSDEIAKSHWSLYTKMNCIGLALEHPSSN